jgi:flagellar biosynthetic protein FliR
VEALTALGLGLLPMVLLVSIRVGIALIAFPAPFSEVAPPQVRAALGLLIALAISVSRTEIPAALELAPLTLIRGALGEVAVGLVIGLTVRVTLAAVETAGSLAGTAMGLGFATTVDPLRGEEVLPTTSLLGALGGLVFFALRGHHAVLAALGATLDIAPPGAALDAVMHEGVLRIGGDVVAHGLRIAAPVIATMFIVQLGTALVARSAPRVQVFSLTFAVATSVGLLTLSAAAPSIIASIAETVEGLPAALATSLGGTP